MTPEAPARGTPIVGLALASLVVAVATLRELLGVGGDAGGVPLASLGAVTPWPFLSAEPERVIAGAFLHAGRLHAAVNALALLGFATLAEPVLGRARLLAIVMAASTCGFVASATFPRALLMAGGSGMTYGCLGALVALAYRLPDRGGRKRRAWLTGLLLLAGFAVELALPVDVVAHAVALAAGAALALAAFPPRGAAPAPSAVWVRLAAAICVLLILLAATTRAVRFAEEGMQNGVRLMVAQATGGSPPLQIAAADALVIWPDVAHADLARIARVLEGIPAHAADRSRALLALRMGDVRGAYALARGALHAASTGAEAVALTMLAAAGCTDARSVGLSGAIRGEGPERTARFERLDLGRGGTAFALAVRGERVVGLWRLRLGRGAPAVLEVAIGGWGDVPAGTRLHVFGWDEGAALADDRWAWNFWSQPKPWDAVPEVFRRACAAASR